MLRERSEHVGELLEFRRRTDQNLAEITDKLNGLIGYRAGIKPPGPRGSCGRIRSTAGHYLKMTNVERAIKDLQDSLIVIAEIERRQSSIIREHAERIVHIDERLERVSGRLEGLTVKVDEITDKLNGLIGYVAGQQPPPPPLAH